MIEKLFTLAEVRKHNDNQSCWLVIHNNVFDVTKFLHEHPGGEEEFLERAGKECSEAFEDVGHSSDARQLMLKYKIGEIVEAERKPIKEKIYDLESNSGVQTLFDLFMSWIVPITLCIIAPLLYAFYNTF